MKEIFQDSEKLKILMQGFTAKLNREPDPREFEKTPDNKASFLPISFIEMTLDELFFGQWSTENFHWSAITNEVQGSMDLVVIHPVTGEKISRTGAASIVITVDSLSEDAKNAMSKQARNLWALDPQNKKPNALDMGFPKLKAECLKNAASSLGKVFGRDINRKQKDVFKPALKPLNDKALLEAVERIEKGEIELIPLLEDSFLLTDIQIELLHGAQQQKQLAK